MPYSNHATIRFLNPSQITMTGRLSARYSGNLSYLKGIYKTRKEWMLEPFYNYGQEWVLEPLRNKKGEIDWAGEYAGKWLDAASLAAMGSRDEQLDRYVAEFASAFIDTQQPDGYLGIEGLNRRGKGWDIWNLWNAILGLVTHYEVYNDPISLAAAMNCSKWLIDQFGVISDSNNSFFSSAHDNVCNSPIIEEIVRLYKITHDQSLLNFATSVVDHYPYMDIIRNQGKAPLLHVYHLTEFLAGVVDLAITDNRPEELQWIESAWEDLVETHLYPTGSLGYRELLRETAPNDIPVENGEPDKHHQETCGTVGWLLLNSRLYQATGRVRYIQHLEQTIYNALLAAQSTDGMSWMYYSPLRYERKWFSGPTSCCYWSGPRGIARLPEWVYACDNESIFVNFYESSLATFHIDEHVVSVKQSSNYPDSGQVVLQIQPEESISFPLRLRIPYQAVETTITLNDRRIRLESEMEGYFTIHRKWSKGDRVEMKFNIPVVVHEFLNDQYGVVVRGPEVLAVDQRDNPSIDLDQLVLQRKMVLQGVDPVEGRRRYSGEVIINGLLMQVFFTPYADTGGDGARFRTAFPVR